MIVVDSILETIVENLSSEVKSKVMKLVIAVVFIFFYLFIVSGIIAIGFGFIDKNIFLGSIFILIAIIIFVFFTAKFIIIYNKKMNKKKSFLSKLFKIEKKK